MRYPLRLIRGSDRVINICDANGVHFLIGSPASSGSDWNDQACYRMMEEMVQAANRSHFVTDFFRDALRDAIANVNKH